MSESQRSKESELARLKEQVRQLQDRRDRMFDEMLLWRGIDREGGDIPCKACGGAGVRAYGDTTTWRGGIGGQRITRDVCNKCWGSGNAEKPFARKVWIVHEIEVDRYADRVKFHGIATNEEERERLSRRNPDATVTEIEPDTDVTEYGAESFHETPSW